MAKNRIDWVAELNSMIIDEENLKNQLFTLKNGKKIKSSLFHYGNGQVHGEGINGRSFRFSVGDLVKIKSIKDEAASAKRAGRFVGQAIDTNEHGSTVKNLINKNEPQRGHFNQAFPTGTESNSFC